MTDLLLASVALNRALVLLLHVIFHVIAFSPTDTVRDGQRDATRYGDIFQVIIRLWHVCLFMSRR